MNKCAWQRERARREEEGMSTVYKQSPRNNIAKRQGKKEEHESERGEKREEKKAKEIMKTCQVRQMHPR